MSAASSAAHNYYITVTSLQQSMDSTALTGTSTSRKQVYRTDIMDMEIVGEMEAYKMRIMDIKVTGTMAEESCEDP